MSYQRVEQVKKRPPFALWDLLIYGILAVAVVLLFVVFVFTADKSAIEGVQILFQDEVAYTYSFEEGGTATQGYESRFALTEEDGKIVLIAYADDTREHFNRIEIDETEKSVKVTDSNCSRHRDCVFMDEIKTKSGVIICVPHAMKVVPLDGKQDFSNPTVG